MSINHKFQNQYAFTSYKLQQNQQKDTQKEKQIYLPQIKNTSNMINFLNFDKKLYEIYNGLNQLQADLENKELDIQQAFKQIDFYKQQEQQLFDHIQKQDIPFFVKNEKIKNLQKTAKKRNTVLQMYQEAQIFLNLQNNNSQQQHKSYQYYIQKSKEQQKNNTILGLKFVKGFQEQRNMFVLQVSLIDTENQIAIENPSFHSLFFNQRQIGLLNKIIINEKPNQLFCCYFFELSIVKNQQKQIYGWTVLPVKEIQKTEYKKLNYQSLSMKDDLFKTLTKNLGNNFLNKQSIQRPSELFDHKIMDKTLEGKYKLPFYKPPAIYQYPIKQMNQNNRINDLYIFLETKQTSKNKINDQYIQYLNNEGDQIEELGHIIPEIHQFNEAKTIENQLQKILHYNAQQKKENQRLQELSEIQYNRIQSLKLLRQQKVKQMFNKEKQLLKILKNNIFEDNEEEKNPQDQAWNNYKKQKEREALKIKLVHFQSKDVYGKLKVRIKFFFNENILKNDLGEEINVCTKTKNKDKKSAQIEYNQTFDILFDFKKFFEIYNQNVIVQFKVFEGKNLQAWLNFDLGDSIKNKKLSLKTGVYKLNLNDPPSLNFNSKKKPKQSKNKKIKFEFQTFKFLQKHILKHSLNPLLRKKLENQKQIAQKTEETSEEELDFGNTISPEKSKQIYQIQNEKIIRKSTNISQQTLQIDQSLDKSEDQKKFQSEKKKIKTKKNKKQTQILADRKISPLNSPAKSDSTKQNKKKQKLKQKQKGLQNKKISSKKPSRKKSQSPNLKSSLKSNSKSNSKKNQSLSPNSMTEKNSDNNLTKSSPKKSIMQKSNYNSSQQSFITQSDDKIKEIQNEQQDESQKSNINDQEQSQQEHLTNSSQVLSQESNTIDENMQDQFNNIQFKFKIKKIEYVPRDVVLVGLKVGIIDKNFKKIMDQIQQIGSQNKQKSINFQQEFEIKQPNLPNELYLFVRLFCIDQRDNGELKQLGFYLHPIFLEQTSNRNSSVKDKNIKLNKGQFKERIFGDDIKNYQFQTIKRKKLNKIGQIPGMFIEFIIYEIDQQIMKNSTCNQQPKLKKYEQELINQYQSEQNMNYMDALQQNSSISHIENIMKMYQQVELHTLPKFQFQKFNKYQSKFGFSINVDGIFQSKNKDIFLVVYFPNPPAHFYEENIGQSKTNDILVGCSKKINWDSKFEYLKFSDKFTSFKNLEYDENMSVIFSIKRIQIKARSPIVSDFAWGILPVFEKEGLYVRNGIYQIPLYRGDTDQFLCQEISEINIYSVLDQLKKRKNVFKSRLFNQLEKTSLIVRIKDNQLGNLIEDDLIVSSVNKSMIPSKFVKNLQINEQKLQKINKSKQNLQVLLKRTKLNEEQINFILKQICQEIFLINQINFLSKIQKICQQFMKFFLFIAFIGITAQFEDFTRLGKIKENIEDNDHDHNQFFGENYIETEIKCNRQLLINYGMQGLPNAIIYPHDYCPSIQKNCCTIEDMHNSLQEWDNILKFNIERWYETYLISIKYLIGYSDEVSQLTQKILENSDYSQSCIKTAEDIRKLKLNNINTIKIYDEIKKGLDKFKELRKGFFCMLCDAHSQGQIQDQVKGSNIDNSIYLSKGFCEGLVQEMITSSFYLTSYVVKFLEHSSALIKCVKPTEEALKYEYDFQTQKIVRNCYNFHHKYFFFFCESYCERFDIVKQTNLFEGNLVQLQKFVLQFQRNKRAVFDSPQNNILCDGVAFEEELLSLNFKKFQTEYQGEKPVFFKPSVQNEFLENFDSDVVYYGGIDLWKVVEANKYYFILNSFKIALPSIILMLLFQII